MTSRRLSARTYLVIAQIGLVACVVNVLSGASVRLTDSGLGCADWPSCDKSRLTPPLSFHPVMEFANRMVVGLLVVAAIVAFLGSLVRERRRGDLVWLSGLLAAGVLGEAGVGAAVVYSKLNPYVVMVHFLLGMSLVAVAFFLALRSGRARVKGPTKVTGQVRRIAHAMLAVLVVVLAAGTATTGAGPHAGGQGAKRIPVPLADMARTHSSIVFVLAALTLLELWMLQRSAAPVSVIKRGQLLLAFMVAQGLVGYTQYFTQEPALVVGIHIAGALSVWLGALWFYDGLSQHPPENPNDVAPAADDARTPLGTSSGNPGAPRGIDSEKADPDPVLAEVTR